MTTILSTPVPGRRSGPFRAFLLALGGIGYMHGMSLLWIVPGLIGIAYTMLAWWIDVVKEAEGGYHTPVVQLHMRYGMILFIASEVMFFVAWFWAFFDASLMAGEPNQVARYAFHRWTLAAGRESKFSTRGICRYSTR